MIIELWGVRGSLPAPTGNTEYRSKIREIIHRAIDQGIHSSEEIDPFIAKLPQNLQHLYGGNTTCVTVQSKNGNTYILDCGTGIRPLGDILMSGKAGKGADELHIFITHTHWDHIQGIPFFKPIYIPGNTIHFHSGLNDLHERLQYQQTERFFPVALDDMASTKKFHLIEEGVKYQLEDDLFVEGCRIKHPGGCMAYRFTEANRSFIFATDAEFTGEYLEELQPEKDAFFRNADLLVIDSQYTLDEAFKKFDWGHTSYTMAINCAVRWKIRHLVLTHHEPAYLDEKLFTISTDAVDHRNAMETRFPVVHMAREGMRFEI